MGRQGQGVPVLLSGEACIKDSDSEPLVPGTQDCKLQSDSETDRSLMPGVSSN